MAVGAHALTTLAKLKAALGISASTYDTQLEDLIDEISDAIESYVGHDLHYEEDIEEKVQAGDRYLLKVSRTPVVAVVSVAYDGTALDSALYEIESANAGMIRLLTGPYHDDWSWALFAAQRVPGTARKLMTITYDGGYTLPASGSQTLPKTITRAATSACVAAWLARGRDLTITSRTLGKWAESYGAMGDASMTGLPPAVCAMLAPWRRAEL